MTTELKTHYLKDYTKPEFLIDTVDLKYEKAYVKVQKNNFGILNTFVFRPMLHIQKFEDRNFDQYAFC